MPKDTSIEKILLIGSGPIVIGQGCEFDYSGVQACKALQEEGYTVVLVNSNPATIMTDPEFADATYVEPITPESSRRSSPGRSPDALLPTLGGQTGAEHCDALVRDAACSRSTASKLIGANARGHRQGRGPAAVPGRDVKIGLGPAAVGDVRTRCRRL